MVVECSRVVLGWLRRSRPLQARALVHAAELVRLSWPDSAQVVQTSVSCMPRSELPSELDSRTIGS
jgi:hypothetical protein